jgi:predicted metal-dependent peptidase
MNDAMQRMIKGRIGLITREPFFATLALSRLNLVEDPKCKTHWVDGKRLGFNPAWALAATMDELEAAWAHQVLTCALGHPFRRGSRDEKLWNDASDYTVNPSIQRSGFKLPEGALIDPRFDGMYTEAIFSELKREQIPQPEDGGGEGSPRQQPSGNDLGEVRDSPGGDGGEAEQPASAAEMAEQEADWQTAVAQAAQAARGAGKLSGDMERLSRVILEAKVDWREALQRKLLAKAKDDYSWARPNRHFIPYNMYLPSLDSRRCGILAFAIDVSGSINQPTVDQFVAEVHDARAILKPEKVVILMFDTTVKAFFEFDPGEPIVIRAQAGGGTAFTGPVLELEERGIVPEVLVYLTDLCSSEFPAEPDYPVVWVTTRPGEAPFGEVIPMY